MEVRDLAMWCQDNNLSLKVIKTKEMIVDYSKKRTEHAPILIGSAILEQVESFKFLGIHITNKLPRSKHTKTVVKRARQNLFPLRRHGFSDPQKVIQLHQREHPDWLHHCLVWQLLGHKALQKYITGAKLSAIQDLYTRWCQRKAQKMIKDSSHPSHRLFSLLLYGKRYRSPKSRAKRLLNSFYPQAIRLLNR